MDYLVVHNIGEPAREHLQSVLDELQQYFDVARLQLPPHVTLKYQTPLENSERLEALCKDSLEFLGADYSISSQNSIVWTHPNKGATFSIRATPPSTFEPITTKFTQCLHIHSFDLEAVRNYHITLAMRVKDSNVAAVRSFIADQQFDFHCVFNSLSIVRFDGQHFAEHKTYYKI